MKKRLPCAKKLTTKMEKNNSRAVGHTYERAVRLELIDLGWTDCKTARYASRETDDANVDFIHTEPFNIQCKRWVSAPSYHEEEKQNGNN